MTKLIGFRYQAVIQHRGGEEYLTIGNFFNDANTQTTGTGSTIQSYYLIDDVKVEEMTTICVTGVNELSSNYQMQVYPNPTIGNLKVIINNLKDKEKSIIKIIDLVGKEVLSSSYKEEFDILRLEQGIYFLSVYSANERLGTTKIVKE